MTPDREAVSVTQKACPWCQHAEHLDDACTCGCPPLTRIGTVRRNATAATTCEHIWKYAHVVKRGLQRYRIYFCERCLAERSRRV